MDEEGAMEIHSRSPGASVRRRPRRVDRASPAAGAGSGPNGTSAIQDAQPDMKIQLASFDQTERRLPLKLYNLLWFCVTLALIKGLRLCAISSNQYSCHVKSHYIFDLGHASKFSV
jgi:hypothetical protein